ncbi:hypothetical protein GGX14DRAFT_387000 [Mycena pura]|uniref:Uncharacterized protein n=1 Tax=Mycena pura TaxID=153505 RepID=A0AAD6YMV9_9AGAR|nr:hypothetical protein GGX14DRAFT_387000 [Mycena pura]
MYKSSVLRNGAKPMPSALFKTDTVPSAIVAIGTVAIADAGGTGGDIIYIIAIGMIVAADAGGPHQGQNDKKYYVKHLGQSRASAIIAIVAISTIVAIADAGGTRGHLPEASHCYSFGQESLLSAVKSSMRLAVIFQVHSLFGYHMHDGGDGGEPERRQQRTRAGIGRGSFYYVAIVDETVPSRCIKLDVLIILQDRLASKINARPKPPSQPQHRAGCTRAARCNCPSARLACLLLAPRRKAPAKIIEDSDNGSFHLADYESEERDPPANAQASDNEHEDDDDAPAEITDAAEAAECKATKAARAAEKQHCLETGARPAPVPVRDTVFVSREVGTNQPKKKLVERSSRVPVSPARRPLVVANGSCPVPITGTSITDWRQYVGHPIPEDYNDHVEPRLYDINSKRLLNRVCLDLRTVSQDITQVPEGAQPMVSDLPAVPLLLQAAIEAAIKEFDEDSATESDGENGEKSD